MTRRLRLAIPAALTVPLAMGIGSAVSAQELPSYYPETYGDIVEASKNEGGLLIYSNMAQYNWQPVIEGFNALYPWIEVSTLDLDSDEVFTRYYAETSSGAETTDLMISATMDGWLNFMNGGHALDYGSPEADQLPDWSKLQPNLYTVSTDPMIMVYNKLTVPEEMQPKGIGDLVRIVNENPGVFDTKLTTYNSAQTSFGQAIDLVYLREHGDAAWDQLDTLGPLSRTEVSSGPMLAKIASGEYSVGYFISGIVFFPKLNDPTNAQIMGWNFIDDGTPLFMREMAIPKEAGSPNAAKLMLDYILSHAGQTAFGVGGLTPYREGVKKEDVAFYTYDSIKEEIGEDNILLIDYDPALVADLDSFVERWREAYQQK
ncbi:ABC transporter substrate-binding protein [Marinivivus vitaminiproducens]|uniref:ABC transporter substrate-binding protein n=1 Tax=Marinivivus vitaminiproducens TaxID=3035935 RepID=UPI0027A823D4|nr:ABC transporter substrate-binding protein [Geminicoccaceae bacterium SCSIO 64248]